MINIIIKNELTGIERTKAFKDQAELEAWRDERLSKLPRSWGKKARQIFKDQATQEEIGRALSEEEVLVNPAKEAWTEKIYASYDQDGNGIGEPIQTIDHPARPAVYATAINLPDDYIIEIIDEETNAEFKKKMNKKRRQEQMPSLEERVNALLAGGQKLEAMKKTIRDLKTQYPIE